MSLYSALARPFLFALDAESAHDLVMGTLANTWAARALGQLSPAPVADGRLRIEAFGLPFENPVGLAAGLDKQGTAVGAWSALGFGATEIGTVTPRPQPGNARPRLFRLPEDRALINRFGFNSVGAAGVARNLGHARPAGMRVGINLGRNKDTPNDRAVDDYVAAVEALHAQADYFVINVSSPNTAGLRDLQQGGQLGSLVEAVVARARDVDSGRTIPVLVKLSPDMNDVELLDAVDAAAAAGAAGIIATNTTVSREGLSSPRSLTEQPGGLSGAPLRARANAVCRTLFAHVKGRVPIVGVGGIDSAESAYERIRSGATLIQVYSALIYHGPTLTHEILRGLSRLLDRDGFTHLREAIGIDVH
jgi:dihydroorotate dehydrogenase